MNITINMTHWMLRARRAAAFAGVLLCAGCQPQGPSGTMQSALNEYNAQRYVAAHEQAAAVMGKSTGPQREKAAYLAGLSAYQAGNFDAAEQELSIAAASSDAATAGDAKVMLGQLRLDQHRSREAASNFADASRLLQGEDARQAAWHAGLAYRQANDETNAKRWLDTASSARFDQPGAATAAPPAKTASSPKGNAPVALVSPPAPPRATPAPASKNPNAAASTPSSANTANAKTTGPAGGAASGAAATASNDAGTVGFTLQVGAFNEKRRATHAADEAEDLAKKQSLGRVRVIPKKDPRGQAQYLVQLGWWVTRDEASAARMKIGRPEYIVAPALPES